MKRASARRAGAMVTAMRVVGNIEGKGGKAMTMATKVAGQWTATATKTGMVMVIRVVGEQL
jgi:hypothetical protein